MAPGSALRPAGSPRQSGVTSGRRPWAGVSCVAVVTVTARGVDVQEGRMSARQAAR